MQNWTTGAVLSKTGVTVPGDNIVNATFYPANDSGGVVITAISEAGFGSPGNVNLGSVVLLVIATAVGAVIIYVGYKRRRKGAWKG